MFYDAEDQDSFSLDSAFPSLVPFIREFESEEAANEAWEKVFQILTGRENDDQESSDL